jgi:hypothetical protein
MDEKHLKLLKKCKVMLRSALLPEKDGVAVDRIDRKLVQYFLTLKSFNLKFTVKLF